jgi:hypothetical protein
MPSKVGTDKTAARPAGFRLSRTFARVGLSAPLATFLAGCAGALFLVVWPDDLPMVDAPNHLARLAILAAPEGSALRQMYSVSWGLIPNLGLDLAFLALKGFASPGLVLLLCVLSSMVAMLVAACAIQLSAFGRLSWSTAFVPIAVLGSVWHLGLVNYQMGVGVALAGLALFIQSGRRLDPRHGVLLSAIGVLSLVCHVAAFAAFMLLLSALYCAEELAAPGRAMAPAFLRKSVRLLLVFLPGLLFYAVCQKPDRTWGVHYFLTPKLMLPLFATFGTATYTDVAVLVMALAIFILLGACGGLRIWAPGRPALILFVVVILLLPNQIDNAMLIDSRLMLPLVVLGLSVTRIGSPTRGIRPPIAAAALLVLIGFRVETMLAVETRYDEDVAEFRAATKIVDSQAKVLVAADTLTRADCSRSPVDLGQNSLHVHFGSFLTMDRQAFIPLIFAGHGMQPILPRGAYKAISSAASVPVPVRILQLADDPAQGPQVDALMASWIIDRFVLDWRREFDDMLVLHFGCARNPFPGELTPLVNGAFFTLYRIDRPHPS